MKSILFLILGIISVFNFSISQNIAEEFFKYEELNNTVVLTLNKVGRFNKAKKIFKIKNEIFFEIIPPKYEITFDTGSTITLTLTSSWILQYNTWASNSWFLDNTTPSLTTNINANQKLKLKNFSWYLIFKLNSDNKFENDEKKYKIIKKIWNKNIIKSSWLLK